MQKLNLGSAVFAWNYIYLPILFYISNPTTAKVLQLISLTLTSIFDRIPQIHVTTHQMIVMVVKAARIQAVQKHLGAIPVTDDRVLHVERLWARPDVVFRSTLRTRRERDFLV
jgi:hypothetical protein